ncbi:KR domain-containing protein [Mycobacterium sp. SVM_VP21]|nr:KR domain-containing protein [Mycobacterium sp. SVM_VP21]
MALLELDAVAAGELLAGYPGVEVAGYLSPRQTVVAGAPADVDAVIAAVAAQERFARRVNMEVASHTAFMDPILDELRAELADITPQMPQIPFLSTVVDPLGPTPMLDAGYWADNVRQPARVNQAVAAAGDKYGTFIEISPHPILTHTIDEILDAVPHCSVATLVRDGDDTVAFHQHLNSAHPVSPRELPHPSGPYPVLPATPWRHTHHWLVVESAITAAESAPRPGLLLGTHIKIGSTPTVHLWQARLSPETKPYPGSHRNNGVELVPASVLLQTLADAALEASGHSAVSEIRFEHPIIVDRPRTIQVVADGESVTVSSKAVSDDAGARWVKHLSARITPCGESVGPDADSMLTNGDSGTSFDDDAVTALWLTWGSEGRPFEWSLTSGRATATELHADVASAQSGTAALLDAALHVARLVDQANPELMVPASVDDVRFGDAPTDGRAGVTVLRRDGGEGELIVDLAVTTADGARCVEIRGLRYTALNSATAADDPSSIAHAIDWQPWDAELQTPTQPGTLTVVGTGAAAERLRDGLNAAGHHSVGITEAQNVVYVADPGPTDESDLDCAARLAGEVADLVATLADRDVHPPALWIVTHGVHEAASAAAVRQSCLWGMAGVIRAEQPQLCGGLVDLPSDDSVDTAASAAALSSILRTPAKSILAWRDDQFLTPAFTPISGPPQRQPMVCQPDGAYLITGGMGALGLLMAGWLADRGARRLILAGRSALPPRRDWDSEEIEDGVRNKIAAVRALERRGVTVDVVGLDVGSRAAVTDLLARRDAAGAPPIRGIIHAAGITEGQLLTEVEAERLRDTLWPKVAGAQVLNELFPPGSLDFFFMTAAAGAVFGVPGQGAYASANAYLDGLARARHKLGCHSVSLDWVAWKGLGFGSEAHVVLHELERMGSRPITPAEAFAAWDHVEHYDVAQAVMVPLPREGKPGESASGGVGPVRDWAQLPADEILSELEIGLRSILARELRMSEAELQLDRPFAELGLNSVMAMAVRRDIEQLVGMELSATMLWNHPTTAALAAHLTGKLLPQEDVSGNAAATNGELPEPADSVLNELFDSVESAPAGWDGI